MSIDFSKYSIKELHEAWISIDDHAYPDRAIEIYQLLKAHGEEAHIEVGDSTLDEIAHHFFGLNISGGVFGAEVVLENDLARMKEQRVLSLIKASARREVEQANNELYF